MPQLIISKTSFGAFRKACDQQFISDTVAWAKEQIVCSLDTLADKELARRAELTLAFGRRHQLQEQYELILLYGVLHVLGPGLAADPGFCDALLRLNDGERRNFLYDLLTGRVSPGRRYDTPDWTDALG